MDSIVGEAGDFTVTLIKKPRYIIEDKCTGCGTCTEYCPVQYPDRFNQDISYSKAVHVYFSQAFPLVAYIDESCLYLKEKKCTLCERVCQAGAIDFGQKPQKVEINVGAVILATGLEPYDPGANPEYHYGEFANVVTSMDFERLLSATGAYGGEILRASDLKHPHKIAWISCVGSRRVTEGENSYCSGVCCTYNQKQVILTKEHDATAECTIFHNDIRSFGKDFERFYQRTADLPGVRFIRSYVSIVREDPVTKNVTIRYSTPDEGVKEEDFEMVVLSVGLNPPEEAKAMAGKFGIDLNAHGFCLTDSTNPMETSQAGIFVSGGFLGPADIPDSVLTASAAGSQCGELLNYRRGKLSTARVYPPERDVSGEEPRIGVFVCHCGANIGRIVNVPEAVEYAQSLPNVVYAQEQLFSCATNSSREITDMIREKGLNRVVVAACSPRTLEPLFRDTVREGGLNQYYYEMANIREHNSWVHAKEKEDATQKAKDLIRMSVARARSLEPLPEYDLPVDNAALVVGGGIAGMTCALSIADQGHEVYLVEKEKELGGTARRIHYTLEGMDVQAYLNDLIGKVYRHPLVHVYTGATITEAGGYIGNFVTRVKSGRGTAEIRHGATVIAIGAEEYKPTEYLYGQDERVMTQLELEERIAKGDEKVLNAGGVVMIQCVGCRNEERNYCSKICCSHAVKNALKLKEKNPEMDVSILFRDMRTYGYAEDYYREASEKDVKFIRFEPEDAPQVEAVVEEGKPVLRVTVADPILGQRLALDADCLVLSAATIPSAATPDVASLFKVTLNPDGFFKEAHVKLRPVEFGTDGVYLCGMAQYPKHIPETISQAYGAAGRVLTLLSRDIVTASGAVARVDEEKCVSCGACITVCSYGAIDFYESPRGRRARVNPVLCKGDGVCNTVCPTSAVSLKHFTDEEILNQVEAAVQEEELLQLIDSAV
ncbi:heterodisulfide reductase, subunit A [Syntrophus aciditrophicus SB]|uniref:Heterodisulfide reductase, subunit A n=1 Tax=Syntrophus aciditrophicus (strain SB) TaxID=56780 RepID=Q2LXV1_SYNAS|nr:heterodisulfide reductase, subunit A [Syntrophus aciditrophicus SB]